MKQINFDVFLLDISLIENKVVQYINVVSIYTKRALLCLWTSQSDVKEIFK